MWKENDRKCNDHSSRPGNLSRLPDDRHHRLPFLLPDKVTYHRIDAGGKAPGGNRQDQVYHSHQIGDSQLVLPRFSTIPKKDKPTPQPHESLRNDGDGKAVLLPDQCKVYLWQVKQVIGTGRAVKRI